MDRALSVRELAEELGTTPPRVYRAVHRGLIRPMGLRPIRFGPEAVARLRGTWGSAPMSHRSREHGSSGWRPSREDLLVLAAVSRHPLGLRSARAVARLAGVSPTTASRSLGRLLGLGVVRRRLVRVVEGTLRDLSVWTIAWRSPAWAALRDSVRRSVLPSPPTLAHDRQVPIRLRHLFWDTDWRHLRTDRHGPYIVDRILRMNDLQALAWMAQVIDRDSLRRAASRRGLTPAQRRLALVLADSA